MYGILKIIDIRKQIKIYLNKITDSIETNLYVDKKKKNR